MNESECKTKAKLENLIEKFGPTFKMNEKSLKMCSLFCVVCKKDILCQDKSRMKVHIERRAHQSLTKKSKICNINQDDFEKIVCEMLVKMTKPLFKVKEESFGNFINKFTEFKSPSVDNLRRKLPEIYREKIGKIKAKLCDKYIYVAIDETKDRKKRNVINIIVGELCATGPGSFYLVDMLFAPNVNNIEITHNIISAVNLVFDNDTSKYDQVLLFLSDAASYNMTAGRNLPKTFKNLIHLTCVIHNLHNVVEEIAKYYKQVNQLIYDTKAIYAKASLRRADFKKEFGVYPPNPIQIRWGEWLKSVKFYRDNYERFVAFMSKQS